MTHLAYIVPSYLLGVLIPGGFAIAARHRLAVARARLAAVETRKRP